LSTEEEFLPGQNSFADEKGSVYSDSVGEKAFDLEEKVVNVSKKSRDIKLIERNCIVYGRVSLVKEQIVVMEIVEAFDPADSSKKIVFGSPNAGLPVFSVSRDYVKSLSEFFKVGDVVKARVDNVSRVGIDLETKTDPSLGIVAAYCVTCRQPLHLFEDSLKCASCGSNEHRLISSEYLFK